MLNQLPKWEVRSAIKANIHSTDLKEPRAKPTIKEYGEPLHEFVRRTIKEYGKGKKNMAVFLSLLGNSPYAASIVMPKHYAAWRKRKEKIVLLPTWDAYLPIVEGPARLHNAHVSPTDNTRVRFTPDERAFLEGRTISMRPGRYLNKYYGPDSDLKFFTEAQVKRHAEEFLAAGEPVELKFVTNEDPDGWEWVYENGIYSCMRYNRRNRHLSYGLWGDDHPVRAYARLGNDLALAYIMLHGETEDRERNCSIDEVVVAARTIINTNRKTWLRVYAHTNLANTQITKALEEIGYRESSRTLKGQHLNLREYGGRIICPYLDGNCDQVQIRDDYLLVDDSGIDATQASGLLEESYWVCPMCGDREDEGESVYIESRGENVCEHCCVNNYTEAWVGRRNQEYVPNDDALEYDGEYYTENALSYHNLLICDHCDDVVSLDDAVEVNDVWVCSRHTVVCEVTDKAVLADDTVRSEYDGRIDENVAVLLYPSGECGWIARCYRLDTPSGFINVHKDTL